MFVYIFSPLYQLSTSTLSVNRGGRRVFVIALHFRDFIFSFCQWWRLIGNCHRDLPMHCRLVTDRGHEIEFLGSTNGRKESLAELLSNSFLLNNSKTKLSGTQYITNYSKHIYTWTPPRGEGGSRYICKV